MVQDQLQRGIGYGVGYGLLTVAWLAIGPFLILLDTRTVWRRAVLVSLISLSVESLGDVDLRHQPLALIQFAAATLVLVTSVVTLQRSTAKRRVSTVTSAESLDRGRRCGRARHRGGRHRISHGGPG